MKNWLPIRQDYLIENFESLLEALSDVDYDNSQDGLLSESVIMLEEVASDLLSDYFSHQSGVTNTEDNDFIRNIRIVLTSIYASAKRGRPVADAVASLLDTLVINQKYQDEDSIYKVRNIVVNLAHNIPVQTLPYSLRDLDPKGFDLNIFRQKLLGFIFADVDYDHGEDLGIKPVVGFESRGSCVFDRERIYINPVGLSQLSDVKLKEIQALDLNVAIRSEDKRKPDDMEFKERVTYLNRLVQSMEGISTPAARRLKTYSENQDIYVRVTEINPVRKLVMCRTMDPDYEALVLQLNLPAYITVNTFTDPYPWIMIHRDDFISLLKPKDVMKVRMEEKDGKRCFSIVETFEEYFWNIDNFSGVYEAIFISTYRGGTRWLTDLGHTVNIMNNPSDDDIKKAESVEGDFAIEINYGNRVEDNKGNPVINAQRAGNLIQGRDHSEFLSEIPQNIINDLLDFWEEECPSFEMPEDTIPGMPEIYVKTVGHLLSALGEDVSRSFISRYSDMVAAMILAIMTGSVHDEAYCEFSLSFLRAVWAFLQDSGHDWLHPLETRAELDALETVRHKKEAVRILRDYKKITYTPTNWKGRAVDVERLRKLVDASNALSGNIAMSELNRVKRTIAQCLGAAELYREDASDRYCFGEESDVLEFKTSVVYPPVKNGSSTGNPNVQIWNILRTVNGFLNSLHGGTLLIGVNDFGHAEGVDSDIKWLYDKGLLLVNNVDRYIQYVKLRVDHAFQAYRREDSDTDITSTRVRYSSFPIEGKNIVRVDVMPYEMGCVKIKEKIGWKGATDIKRPANVKEAYIRNATVTEELTQAARLKLEAEKRMVIKDGEERKYIIIQEAIESKHLVTLKGYKSKSRECDRVLEPIELLPQRRLVVGIEKGGKELRVFKLSRCEEVVMAEEPLKRASYNVRPYKVDPFNMLYEGGKGEFNLKLRLDRMGWLLLQESYPYAAGEIEGPSSGTDYPYTLTCRISDVRGVGSFCLSILGHFQIVDCEPLERYIDETYAAYKNNS